MTTITEPHPNAYVTVVDGVAHWPGKQRADQRHTAACSAALAGPSWSYGWARSLGATLCREPGCYAPPGDRLWMATRRRGLDHHRLRPEATKTDCDRFAGLAENGELDNGILVSPAIVAELDSKRCKRCWPPDA